MKPLTISRRALTAAVPAACLAGAAARSAHAAPGPRFELSRRSLTQLKSDLAALSDGLVPSSAKGMWIEGWASPGQSFTWPIRTAFGARFKAVAVVAARPGSRLVLKGPVNALEVAVPASGDWWGENWGRVEFPGELLLPAGDADLRLSATTIAGAPTQTMSKGAALVGIELLPTSAVRTHDEEVRADRSDASWLGKSGYGLMFQWGEWSMPQHGDKKPWPQQIDDFDVERFADMVASTGARYLVWSVTWRTYYFPAPISSIEAILPGRTCARDLVREIGEALRRRRIRLIVYYNCGFGDKPWHDRNFSTDDPSRVGLDPLFERNWLRIISEVGARYRDLLSGWLIDEGWYPRDFRRAAAALKAGYAGRIVSINSWVRPRLTDFQDFYFGEGFDGLPATKGANLHLDPGGSGVFQAGPQKGLQAHGCFLLDTQSTLTDWAIWQKDAAITPPLISDARIRELVRNARKYRIALSFAMMMYEDGSVSQQTLDRLVTAKRALSESEASA